MNFSLLIVSICVLFAFKMMLSVFSISGISVCQLQDRNDD